jgi:putative flippase GtrA|tara:strand:+ start:919 stop:1368 length:450 start_codon:yes stop_codon:yes gene_type:complete
MYSFFKKNKKNFQELLKTYVVGIINLIVGLSLTYIFQFFVFQFISFPLRTYLTNVTSFSIGVVISYYLSRLIIFNLKLSEGKFKEFLNFLSVNLISLVVPNIVWFVINLFNSEWQQDEVAFLVITFLINGFILPLKYLFYKLFVFKDSL